MSPAPSVENDARRRQVLFELCQGASYGRSHFDIIRSQFALFQREQDKAASRPGHSLGLSSCSWASCSRVLAIRTVACAAANASTRLNSP
jgi:hypothetical protein